MKKCKKHQINNKCTGGLAKKISISLYLFNTVITCTHPCNKLDQNKNLFKKKSKYRWINEWMMNEWINE